MGIGRRVAGFAGALLLLGMGSGTALGAGAAGDEWRLDIQDKTYAPNAVFGNWKSRKFAPYVGSGERYFFQFVHDGKEHEIILRSGKNNSFSLGLETPFRLQDWPVVEWEWRMVQMPKDGDVRVKELDDQAGSLCFIVNPGLIGFKSLCYLFENDGPKDSPITSRKREDSRYLIVRTAKADKVGVWLKERRNILEDYRRVFGKDPAEEAVIGFQIDSDDTQTSAEARYRNLYLRKK